MADKAAEKEEYRQRILDAVSSIGAEEAEELSAKVTEESLKRGLTYMRGGVVEPIRLMLAPAVITRGEAAYLHVVAEAVKRGVDEVYRAWFIDPALASLMPFGDREERLVRALSARPRAPSGGEPLWFRLDAHMAHPSGAGVGAAAPRVFEINSCAVGGIHYGPTADAIFMEAVWPSIARRTGHAAPPLVNPDTRALLAALLKRHASAIGRRTLNVAYVEDTALEDGITEGPSIVERMREAGINAALADPRELTVDGGEVRHKGAAIDVIYRNFEIGDLLEWEEAGIDASPLKYAFLRNQVVSSVAGDFDHKSVWEALTSGEFDRYFTPADAALFKKHLPWTRVIRERRTALPDGAEADLAPFVLKNRERLVIKPNRLCGGYGVVIGVDASGAAWGEAIDAALKEPGGWVVQEYAPPGEEVLPFSSGGAIVFERHNVVFGISSTRDGAGVLGRVSRMGVVNVAREGALMPVLRLP